METELSFLLTILLEHKIPKATKDALKERIKKIQEVAPITLGFSPPRQAAPMPSSIQQAASTQRLLAEHGIEAPTTPMPPVQQVIRLPPSEIDKETGRASVATGNGTRGPRKF